MPRLTRPQTPEICREERVAREIRISTPKTQSMEVWVDYVLTEHRRQAAVDLQIIMEEQRQWLQMNFINHLRIRKDVPMAEQVLEISSASPTKGIPVSDDVIEVSSVPSAEITSCHTEGTQLSAYHPPTNLAIEKSSSHGSKRIDRQISKSLAMELIGQELRLCACVTKGRIDLIAVVCIMLNMCSMFLQLQWRDYEARVSLGSQRDDGEWANAETYFLILEHVFNAIFLAEVVARFSLVRWKYFKDGFNLFDFFLVAITSLQMYVLEPLTTGNDGDFFVIFRLLRFGRAVRVLRIVRIMRFITELRILIQTFVSSVRALAWSMLFLFFNILLGALFLSFSLQDFIHTDSNDYATRVWAHRYYGSGWRSLYTLFEVTLAGCWPTYFRPLIEQVHVWYAVFIVTYISVVVFAVTRIITALFLTETMQTRSYDAEVHKSQTYKNTQLYINNLRRVFEAADVEKEGTLDAASFKRMCHNKDVIMHMKHLELEIHDAQSLFYLLDVDTQGKVNFEDFLRGVMRLKGHARSMDMIAMMRASDRMSQELRTLHKKVSKISERLAKAPSTEGLHGQTSVSDRHVVQAAQEYSSSKLLDAYA